MDGNKFWAGMFELTPVEGEAGDWGTSQVRRKWQTKLTAVFWGPEGRMNVRVWS